MPEIRVLRTAPPAAAGLAGMTFPAYRRLLALERSVRHPEQGDRRPIDPLAVAAWEGGCAVGLALAELPVADRRPSELLSVFVQPSHRRRGLAGALVAAVEQAARERGFTELRAVYTAGGEATGYLERVFARRRWSEPRARTLSVRFTPEAARRSAMFEHRRTAALARDLEIFPWSDLSEEERRELRASDTETPWITPALRPWRFDRLPLHPSSVGARRRGEVVGWVLNHAAAPGVVRFTASFMHKGLSRRGRILPLYAASLDRLVGTDCRLCTFVTPVGYTGMNRLVRRWIAPFALFVGETRGTSIDLAARA